MCLYVILALCTINFSEADSLVRGIYINPYQAARRVYLKKVFARADSGLINTIVVDFKSDYGFLSYRSKLKIVRELNAYRPYLNVNYLVENARAHNLKLVARIVCFRDRYLAFYKDYGIKDDQGKVWLDNKGIAWLNPYKKGVQDYLIKVAREITDLGIKSIVFDYVRFPADGDVKKIRLTAVSGPRTKPIVEFLKRARAEIDAEIGVCVYGYAVWRTLKAEGQDITKMKYYIDILCPMLYPSHFGASFCKGINEYWRNYWIYFDSVKRAKKELAGRVRVIPFIQGFDYRVEEFNPHYIISQMDGLLSAGANGFIIWHAGADYTISWPALSWAHNAVLIQDAQNFLSNHRRALIRRHQETGMEKVLSPGKSRMKNQKVSPHHSLIDNLPSGQTLKSFSDPLIP